MSFRKTSSGPTSGADLLRSLIDKVAVLERNQNSGGGTPTGAMLLYGGAGAPAGFALCDGASYLRADPAYSALFAVIGTAFGAVDGTHFTVPTVVNNIIRL